METSLELRCQDERPELVSGAGGLQDGPSDPCLLVYTPCASPSRPPCSAAGLWPKWWHVTCKTEADCKNSVSLSLSLCSLTLKEAMSEEASWRSPRGGEEPRPPPSSHATKLRVCPPAPDIPTMQPQPAKALSSCETLSQSHPAKPLPESQPSIPER